MIGHDEELWLRVAALTQVACDQYKRRGLPEPETIRLEVLISSKTSRPKLGQDGPSALQDVGPRRHLSGLGGWLADAVWAVEDIRRWVAVKHSAWRLGLEPHQDPNACADAFQRLKAEYLNSPKGAARHVGRANSGGAKRPKRRSKACRLRT